ncbi:MAG: hypothetical protein IKQ00_04310 [Butyrivibrio sp.]|nr:hypothetical protein [Butyrivibrio sp.]
MRLRIIIPLLLLIFTTACGAKNKKLIAIESELVQDQGNAQICVYNDVFEAYGKKSNYTFIDIIKDNEVKETINTYRYLDKVTDIDCFDFNGDGIKDIALIGYSGNETKILMYESTSDYHYDTYSGSGDENETIRKALDDDFSMETLKSILVNGVAYYTGNLAKSAISAAEKVTYNDYKSAYIGFLRVICECGVDEYGCPGGSYSIYDIDKDSTPELIVHYGGCEADSHVWVYTYTDNKVKCIDVIGTGHSDFFAYPSGNGILQSWAHMGGEEFTLFSLNNNELTAKVLYSGSTEYEDPETGEYDIKFTPERDIVPDTYFLTSFAPDNVFPIEKYEVISAYVPSQDNANYTFPDNNPKFYSEIMEKDNIVNAVSKYRNDPVYKDIHFNDFLKKLEHSPSEIHDITYADLNLDNVYECIFYVLEKDSKDSIRIILSKQGDDIYAYYDSYYMASTGWGEAEKTDITENGFFIEEPNEHFFQNRVMYDKEKWFYYSAPY